MTSTVLHGDSLAQLRTLPDESVQCVVTSPPYWGLRDYGVTGQLGLDATHVEYVANLTAVFREVWRVLRSDGTLWLNLGDSYAGSWGAQSRPSQADSSGRDGSTPMARHLIAVAPQMGNRTGSLRRTPGLKNTDLVGMPWRIAFALQADGWYLRSDIIWHKPNPMPESVRNRPTKAHEYMFLLTKSRAYVYDADAVSEPAVSQRPSGNGFVRPHRLSFAGRGSARPWTAVGERRNRRTVWTIPTQPYRGAHFACFPEKLVEPCILAGCPVGGTVLDPFAGSGTTLAVATRLGRNAIGIELQADYLPLIAARVAAAEGGA